MRPRPHCKSNESCVFCTGRGLPPRIRIELLLQVHHLVLIAPVRIVLIQPRLLLMRMGTQIVM